MGAADRSLSRYEHAWLPLASLQPYARNSRTHSDAQVAQIAASIREFGFANPVLVDEAGRIIAGHGRVLAAALLGLAEVPVIRLVGLDDAQRRAYVIADNKLAMNAGWDDALLAAELLDLALSGFDVALMGFDPAELGGLASPNGVPPLNDEDEVPAAPPTPITSRGDVWMMGRHRLLCGDAATDREHFLGAVVPDLLYLDPPYEIAEAWGYSVPTEKALVFTDHKHIREAMAVVLTYPVQYHFVWDTVISWYTQNRPLCRHRSAFYCAQANGWNADAATYVDGRERNEKTFLSGAFDGGYTYTPLSGGRVRVSTLFKQSKTLDEQGNGKPVAWVRALLAGAEAKEVFEPFAGTGSTIIAAPPGCRVHAIEIDPGKCDSIVARYELATGDRAVRA